VPSRNDSPTDAPSPPPPRKLDPVPNMLPPITTIHTPQYDCTRFLQTKAPDAHARDSFEGLFFVAPRYVALGVLRLSRFVSAE